MHVRYHHILATSNFYFEFQLATNLNAQVHVCMFAFFDYYIQGELPLLSLEALHQLHIFIFVLAVVHVIFCVTTMLLGRAKVLHLNLEACPTIILMIKP